MLNLQLFIENKRVDFFEDESIQLTDSIQDARDIGKIFTAVSRDFTVPATLINNNLFEHFYNFDIVDGFDARQKVSASLFQNGFLYKKGFIQLRSVNLESNKPSSYKIFFTGLLGELKDIFKNDKLSDLLQLNAYTHPYNSATVRAGLQNYFGVTNNTPVFTSGNTQDMCYPFVSSVNRYAFGASGLRTVDSDTNTITNNKIQTSDLKPALRAVRIIEAIETKYGITFDSSFLKTNTIFTELYLWLNRSKGILADETKFDVFFLLPDFDFVSGNNLNLSSENILTFRNLNGQGSYDYVEYNFEYKVEITGKGQISIKIIDDNTSQTFANISQNIEDETLSISHKFESINGGSNIWKPTLQITTESPDITAIDIVLVVNKSESQNGQVFNQTGNYELAGGQIAATSNVNITLQVPSMLVLDFLTSIFNTFNLTAFVQNNGTIKVQTLDDFYDSGLDQNYDFEDEVNYDFEDDINFEFNSTLQSSKDITNQIDINKSEVKRFEPYKDIKFEFQKADSFLMIKRDKILDDVYGNLNYIVGSEDPTKVIGGGSYNVKPKFHKLLPERLRLDNKDLSPIMYALYINEDNEPLSNQPILFYTKRQEFTGSTAIQFQNDDNLTSNIAPSNVKQDLTQTLNFGSEIDEYTLEVNSNSLFDKFYRNFILRAFSVRSKILKVKAYLNADFILNYKLSDTFIINGRKFNINTLDVNLSTGLASLELRNIFDISTIPVPDPPSANQLTISSPSQSQTEPSGSYTFDVFSNVSWTVSESSDFISVSPTSGSNDGTITVTYNENTTTDTRTAVITLTGGGLTREHTLTQSGKPVELTISSASNSVAKEEGFYTFDIVCNTNWVASDNKTWSSQTPNNGNGNVTLTVNYSKNFTPQVRQSIIEVQAGNVTRTHTLTQAEQATTQLFPHDLAQGSTKNNACSESFSQIYYTDNTTYSDSTVIFFDDEGNFRVSAGFYAKGTDVLQTNNNGEVITSQLC